ncbi:MAG: hypothetical protein JJ863_04600 [Deltaproteobacteria bacterium]|nr:hypothetical protein [Deltaproteobacteria bacterium]
MLQRLGMGMVLALVGVGCGDDNGGGGVSLEDAPAAVAESFCNPVEACLGDLTSLFLGGQACTDVFEPAITNGSAPLWQASIDAGRLAYDGSKLDDCIEAASALGCDALEARDIAACDEAFEGLVEPGGACVAEVDCAGEAYCASDAACPGVCTLRAGGGESCTSNEGCVSGLICGSGTCVMPAGDGESCGGSSAIECEAGLLCTGETDTDPGTCKAFSAVFTEAVGAPCNLVDGLDPLCQEGLSCVVEDFDFATMEVTQTCAAPSSSGGACNLGFPEVCPTGEYCNANPMAGMFDGTCVALPAAGETCRDVGDGLGQPCAPAHACVSGTCRALQANGASCTSAGECYSGNCEGGLCAIPDCF